LHPCNKRRAGIDGSDGAHAFKPRFLIDEKGEVVPYARRTEPEEWMGKANASRRAAATPLEVFRYLLAGREAGRRTLLATIVGLTGAGARAVGAHMAVLDDGTSAGSFSSGCVEAAIVAEGREVIKAGRPRIVRFGQGSAYLDIRLPCGDGMDVLFVPDPDPDALRRAVASMESRRPVTLLLSEEAGLALSPDGAPPPDRAMFRAHHVPPLKLFLAGHGAEMIAALDLARGYGAEVAILSPDKDIVAEARRSGVEARHLAFPTAEIGLDADPWSAFLFLFHDHDWEPPLLAAALETPAFWIGAMGSRRTHAARLEALAAAGARPEALSQLRGPIGLIPSVRDPATLALSALAEIVAAYRAVA
jgi:xanthine dehydrogenase accessory factor